jgi:hypothetical protein
VIDPKKKVWKRVSSRQYEWYSLLTIEEYVFVRGCVWVCMGVYGRGWLCVVGR